MSTRNLQDSRPLWRVVSPAYDDAQFGPQPEEWEPVVDDGDPDSQGEAWAREEGEGRLGRGA